MCRRLESPPVSDHPELSELGIRGSCIPPAGAGDMALIHSIAGQAIQMLVVLAMAPLLTGLVRKIKARLLRRAGPPITQPYLDLLKLIRKEVVLADNASWLFRVVPYVVFSATWVATALVPTFQTGLLFSGSGDLLALIALLGGARVFRAVGGMDVVRDDARRQAE